MFNVAFRALGIQAGNFFTSEIDAQTPGSQRSLSSEATTTPTTSTPSNNPLRKGLKYQAKRLATSSPQLTPKQGADSPGNQDEVAINIAQTVTKTEKVGQAITKRQIVPLKAETTPKKEKGWKKCLRASSKNACGSLISTGTGILGSMWGYATSFASSIAGSAGAEISSVAIDSIFEKTCRRDSRAYCEIVKDKLSNGWDSIVKAIPGAMLAFGASSVMSTKLLNEWEIEYNSTLEASNATWRDPQPEDFNIEWISKNVAMTGGVSVSANFIGQVATRIIGCMAFYGLSQCKPDIKTPDGFTLSWKGIGQDAANILLISGFADLSVNGLPFMIGSYAPILVHLVAIAAISCLPSLVQHANRERLKSNLKSRINKLEANKAIRPSLTQKASLRSIKSDINLSGLDRESIEAIGVRVKQLELELKPLVVFHKQVISQTEHAEDEECIEVVIDMESKTSINTPHHESKELSQEAPGASVVTPKVFREVRNRDCTLSPKSDKVIISSQFEDDENDETSSKPLNTTGSATSVFEAADPERLKRRKTPIDREPHYPSGKLSPEELQYYKSGGEDVPEQIKETENERKEKAFTGEPQDFEQALKSMKIVLNGEEVAY